MASLWFCRVVRSMKRTKNLTKEPFHHSRSQYMIQCQLEISDDQGLKLSQGIYLPFWLRLHKLWHLPVPKVLEKRIGNVDLDLRVDPSVFSLNTLRVPAFLNVNCGMLITNVIVSPGIILNLKKEYLFVTDLPRIALNGQWLTQVQVKLAIVPLTVPQPGKLFYLFSKPFLMIFQLLQFVLESLSLLQSRPTAKLQLFSRNQGVELSKTCHEWGHEFESWHAQLTNVISKISIHWVIWGMA